MSSIELAYLAGHFDGDGGLHATNRSELIVYASGSDGNILPCLQLYVKHFGGSIRPKGIELEWRVTSAGGEQGSNPELILTQLIPFLIFKKEPAIFASEGYYLEAKEILDGTPTMLDKNVVKFQGKINVSPEEVAYCGQKLSVQLLGTDNKKCS